MGDVPLYEAIGRTYARTRRPDPRIAARLHAELGRAGRILDVGAGAGSYEPAGREVVAVEPSPTMLAQRPAGAAPAVRAVAGALPFADGAFDAAMAVLTVHHWPDPEAGLREVRRATTGPVVVLTFDVERHGDQWLVDEYLPDVRTLDHGLPSPDRIAEVLGGGRVSVLPVPADCLDGFCHAWWRRPEAYLDPDVRAGISGIARLPAPVVAPAMARLADDLATGAWHRRHADLLAREELDAGYRLVVSP